MDTRLRPLPSAGGVGSRDASPDRNLPSGKGLPEASRRACHRRGGPLVHWPARVRVSSPFRAPAPSHTRRNGCASPPHRCCSYCRGRTLRERSKWARKTRRRPRSARQLGRRPRERPSGRPGARSAATRPTLPASSSISPEPGPAISTARRKSLRKRRASPRAKRVPASMRRSRRLARPMPRSASPTRQRPACAWEAGSATRCIPSGLPPARRERRGHEPQLQIRAASSARSRNRPFHRT